MLIDFALYNPLDDASTQTTIRACSANFDASTTNNPNALNTVASSCVLATSNMQTEVSLQMAWLDSTIPPTNAAANVILAASQLLSYLTQIDSSGCDPTALFASTGQAAIGCDLSFSSIFLSFSLRPVS